MICPQCGHDNIEGVDHCEECAQPLVGVSTFGEMEDSIDRHEIRNLSPKPPRTIGSDATVREAIATMVESRIGCLIVVDDGGKLAGIFTERDVLNRVSDDLSSLDRSVSDFMTSGDIETVSPQDSIAYALHAMDLGGYRHMPIVNDQGVPSGIISVRDILRFLSVRYARLRS